MNQICNEVDLGLEPRFTEQVRSMWEVTNLAEEVRGQEIAPNPGKKTRAWKKSYDMMSSLAVKVIKFELAMVNMKDKLNKLEQGI